MASCSRLWLCPHESVDQHEALEFFQILAPNPNRNEATAFKPSQSAECNRGFAHEVVQLGPEAAQSSLIASAGPRPRSSFTLRTAVHLLNAELGSRDPVLLAPQVFTAKFVRDALSTYDLPICSHLRLSSSLVSDQFRSDCLMLSKLDGRYRPCVCSKTKSHQRSGYFHFKQCPQCVKPGCSTTFGFRAREFQQKGKKCLLLSLTIQRQLGNLLDPLDVGWQHHAFDSKQISGLPSVYRRWLKHRETLRHSWETSRTSTVNRLRRLLHETCFHWRQPEWIENRSLMQDYRLYHHLRYDLTLADLKHNAAPHSKKQDEGGIPIFEPHQEDSGPPPPYSATYRSSETCSTERKQAEQCKPDQATKSI
jgi:hypothetical protein